MSELLSDLNSAQRAAVTAADGPVLVIAGAGSGKTRVLTTRIAYLLEQGLSPSQILAFTFTNKAARQMQARVADSVGDERAPFWIGTFHATGARILRTHADALGLPRDYAVYDADDQKRLLKRVLADLQLDPRQFTIAGARQAISAWKNADTDADQALTAAVGYIDAVHAKIYRAYQEALRSCRAFDFDDLILETVHLLEQHAPVREQYASRFHHVLVDEFQDTNPLQLLLVRLLSSVHGNVFVVGDDDQAIYGWRGARVENMLEFETLFRGTQIFRLEQNYRSLGNILDVANAVIARNLRRKGKSLWTTAERGDPVQVEEHLDAEDEAARLVEIVQAEQARGRPRGDIAVLYRTNAQSRLLEEALRRAQVPHQVVGNVQFYERREVRDLLAYLKLIANPADEVSLQRVVNRPRRKIGETTVVRLLACAREHALPVGDLGARPDLLAEALGQAAARRVTAFLDQLAVWRRAAASQMPVPDLLAAVLHDIDYETFLQADEPETAAFRQENVAELVNDVHAFAEASSGGDLGQYLEQTALVSDQDAMTNGEGAVRLLTMHTAKGLEFPVVVVTGCEDNLLPHASCSDTAAGVEEERRLFYVAITRARQRLYLLYACRRRRFGAYEDSLPSRFLQDVPDRLCERRAGRDAWPQPVARSLFGAADLESTGAGGARGRRPERSPGSRPAADKAPAPRSRLPRAAAAPRTPAATRAAGDQWAEDVVQTPAYYPGQHVVHASFGAGQVVRVEGSGATLTVTVDFAEHGRKHLLPRFAPLHPVD
ncbi:MAG: 3'-5' exonuclease [Candidatus Krumholzibacteria bacterium]|nr:3'-5' exonuclease [Candidatus Krumholzibacteria bacterium]